MGADAANEDDASCLKLLSTVLHLPPGHGRFLQLVPLPRGCGADADAANPLTGKLLLLVLTCRPLPSLTGAGVNSSETPGLWLASEWCDPVVASMALPSKLDVAPDTPPSSSLLVAPFLPVVMVLPVRWPDKPPLELLLGALATSFGVVLVLLRCVVQATTWSSWRLA
ncbi:hypothetical protein NDU88_002166 [Pleurodeles waltl]|uniref:Uncharacterized protein n=1 Tax=Pleurodeles waltl TaxID=8319 RepID=A0AAV7U8W6_PLEWA|nr:hypothetical protein NDU88_002166 [Pleurodeles waltl]